MPDNKDVLHAARVYLANASIHTSWCSLAYRLGNESCGCLCHKSERPEAPWTITRSYDTDLGGFCWIVDHPRAHEHRERKRSWFPNHAEALAFVLAQPEVRRRTSSAARSLQHTAEALS